MLFPKDCTQTDIDVPGLICQQIRSRPKAPAIVSGRREITYSQLGILADAVSASLNSAGVKPG